MCLCMSVHVSVSGVSAHMCAYVCASAYVCLWHVKYKICIFGMYDTESAKCENGTVSVSMCVYVCPFVCVNLYCVCGVPNTKLALAGM